MQPADRGAGAEDVQGALERMLPAGEPLCAHQLVEQLGLWERPRAVPPRPRVSLNMVMSADGQAALEGRSRALSGAADRALFHALRAATDAILVGAATVARERYGRIIKDPGVRELRSARGLPPEPLACVVSGRLSLDATLPLLQERDARVVVLTVSEGSLPPTPAAVEYVRLARDGRLDLEGCLQELAARFGVARVLCEGGPHLARALLEGDLLDELHLSLSPLLAGEGSGALPLLPGPALQPPVALELSSVARGASTLFMRYEVRSRGRV